MVPIPIGTEVKSCRERYKVVSPVSDFLVRFSSSKEHQSTGTKIREKVYLDGVLIIPEVSERTQGDRLGRVSLSVEDSGLLGSDFKVRLITG